MIRQLNLGQHGGDQADITQEDNATQEEAEHAEQNWKIVLEGIKIRLESGTSYYRGRNRE